MTLLVVSQEYVMSALSEKTVLLVTHQVDFLPVFDSILVSPSTSKNSAYDDMISVPLELTFICSELYLFLDAI
jgi:hypothetical protein